jgi:hypothetical protein
VLGGFTLPSNIKELHPTAQTFCFIVFATAQMVQASDFISSSTAAAAAAATTKATTVTRRKNGDSDNDIETGNSGCGGSSSPRRSSLDVGPESSKDVVIVVETTTTASHNSNTDDAATITTNSTSPATTLLVGRTTSICISDTTSKGVFLSEKENGGQDDDDDDDDARKKNARKKVGNMSDNPLVIVEMKSPNDHTTPTTTLMVGRTKQPSFTHTAISDDLDHPSRHLDDDSDEIDAGLVAATLSLEEGGIPTEPGKEFLVLCRRCCRSSTFPSTHLSPSNGGAASTDNITANTTTTTHEIHEEEEAVVFVPNGCAICLDTYQVGETVAWSSTPCHAFHQDCLLEYAKVVQFNRLKMRRRRRLARHAKDDDDDDSLLLYCPCCRQEFFPPGPRRAKSTTTVGSGSTGRTGDIVALTTSDAVTSVPLEV